MPKLVVFGSVAFDSIKTPFGSVERTLGGSAAYASVAASFFTKPGIVSIVGSDFPEEEMDFLKQKGVDLQGLSIQQGKTFFWKGEYGFDINDAKTVEVNMNVLENFKPRLPEDYRKADFLLLGANDPETQLDLIQQMEKKPKLVIADTRDYYIERKNDKVLEVVKKTDVCLMNDSEARLLFNTPNLMQAAREILKLDSDLAIIKKGEHGALLCTEKGAFVAPAYPLAEVADPTGCGDCFAGALMGYLAKEGRVDEELMRKALMYGSAVASFNAEGMGMEMLRGLTLKDINKRFEEFKEIVRF